MAKETLISISERTGYSISTVSRVLNGKASSYRISKKAIEVITKEARKCDYTPCLLAKSLRTNKTNMIGLLVPSIDNPFFANISKTVITEAHQNGYTVMIVDSFEREDYERAGIKSLISRNVDGIMVVPCGQDASYLEDIDSSGTPVVLIDRFFPQTSLPYVSTDNYLGALNATRYLINNGHTNITCIQGIPNAMPSKERVRGYIDALREKGINNETIIGSSFSIQNGYIETKLALVQPTPPTAIFALSNTILLGTIKAILESGLKIPEDISLVSFDDNTYLDFMNPAITRIAQSIDEIGSIAVKILLDNMLGNSRNYTKIKLPPRLIIRDSVTTLNSII